MYEVFDREKLKQKWQEWQQKEDAVGYVQMSDKKPYYFSAPNIHKWDDLHPNNEKCFIWEANIYSEKEKISLSICQRGEGWGVHEKTTVVAASDKSIEHVYICENEEMGKLVFKEVWSEEKDALCENMKVLKPQYTVFVGFKK